MCQEMRKIEYRSFPPFHCIPFADVHSENSSCTKAKPETVNHPFKKKGGGEICVWII